jgi:hypothetical protein
MQQLIIWKSSNDELKFIEIFQINILTAGKTSNLTGVKQLTFYEPAGPKATDKGTFAILSFSASKTSDCRVPKCQYNIEIFSDKIFIESYQITLKFFGKCQDDFKVLWQMTKHCLTNLKIFEAF